MRNIFEFGKDVFILLQICNSAIDCLVEADPEVEGADCNALVLGLNTVFDKCEESDRLIRVWNKEVFVVRAQRD